MSHVALVAPTNVGVVQGTIIAFFEDATVPKWQDKCAFIPLLVNGITQGIIDDAIIRKIGIDITKVLSEETLEAFIKNKTDIYDAYREQCGVVVASIEAGMSTEFAAVMAKIDELAVNYQIPEVDIEPDESYADSFEKKIKSKLQGGISHHVNRVENEKARLDYEANGQKPDYSKIVDLSIPGMVFETPEKQWMKAPVIDKDFPPFPPE